MALPPDPRAMPPVPRDHADASFSEMVPFRSTRIRLFRSPLFLLALLAALVTPFLFGLIGGAIEGQTVQQRIQALILVNIVAVFFIVMLFQLLIYLYVRVDRSIWTFLASFVAVAAILFTPPLAAPFFYVFRTLLPGNFDPAQQYSFGQQFILMFFGAGLMEELLKAVPILIGAWIGMAAARDPAKAQAGMARLLMVRGPLDGAVMGIFAGGGFIFVETAFQYVPNTAAKILQATNDPGTAVASGLLLLLPRVFGGLVGHMAYSGLFGYFIGLAVIRPRQKWKLLGIGWLSAALIHALWNSVPVISPVLMYVIAGVAAVAVVGAILKARQIELSHGGRPVDTMGSIVVDRPRAAPPVMPAAAPPPPPMPVSPAPAAPAFTGALGLDVGGIVIPLRNGSAIDLASEPALGGLGAGVRGVVVPHPTRPDVTGLRNSGDGAWTAQLRDGSQQRIERDQNIRLAPNVRIDFGGGLIGAVVPLG